MEKFTPLEDVKNADDDEWFNIRGKITRLKPESDIHEKMEQEGYISDGSAEIRFVNWGDAPKFNVDDVFEFKNIVTNEYRGIISLSITSKTKIDEISNDDLIYDGKPREQIIREIENRGPSNKDFIDVTKYRVSVDELRNIGDLTPRWDIECNLHDSQNNNSSTPFWEQYDCFDSIPPLGGYNKHILSLYGIDSYNNVVIGMSGSITGIGGTVGLYDRDCLNSVKKLKKLADNSTELHMIEYDKSTKWMHLADCENCGAEFNIKELIGINPYNPDEKHLSFYDWWRETSRHNISVPECPKCDKKELYPPETPNQWKFIQKIPVDKNSSIDDVENKIGKELNFNAEITYTMNETLSINMNKIIDDLSNPIKDALSDSKVKATGDRGLRGIKRRYIRLMFNRSLTENELIEIADSSINYGQGIGRIKDENHQMKIDLTFHKNKSIKN